MSFELDWQNLIALAIVAIAGLCLARQAWITFARKKSGACGSCASCPASAPANDQQVIQLKPLEMKSSTRPS
jgi:hypothetical protein